MDERTETLAIHHKGLRERQDLPNSFEAILRAEKGQTLEMDVFLLKDGSLGVVHQKDLGMSITEVEEMDIRQFQKLDQPQKSKEGISGTVERLKMPLFQEVLGLAYDAGVRLQFELKAGSVERIEKLADAVVKAMLEMKSEGAFDLEPSFLNELSFFSMSVEGMESLAKKLKKHNLPLQTFLSWPSSEKYAREMKISETAITHAQRVENGDWFERGIYLAKDIGCSGISIHAENLIRNPDYVNYAHKLGLQVMVGGVVNNPEEIKKLEEIGVDRYMTEALP